jgi:REP element-mobilizing transposase RayT
MSHTHFLYHIVFGTKDRLPLIDASWENELYRYLAGIVKGHGGEAIEINGMPDHAHLFVRLVPGDFPAFMRELKASSSKWAKRHEPKVAWQRRYGAFTVSESAADSVRDYIRRQKEHHGRRTFEEEYFRLLRSHKIEFDEKYLWD